MSNKRERLNAGSIAVFFQLEALEYVTLFDVGELLQGDAAFIAFGHFLGVILEALQGCNGILADDDTVTHQAQLGIAGDLAGSNTAAGNSANAGNLVDLANLCFAQGDYAFQHRPARLRPWQQRPDGH